MIQTQYGEGIESSEFSLTLPPNTLSVELTVLAQAGAISTFTIGTNFGASLTHKVSTPVSFRLPVVKVGSSSTLKCFSSRSLVILSAVPNLGELGSTEIPLTIANAKLVNAVYSQGIAGSYRFGTNSAIVIDSIGDSLEVITPTKSEVAYGDLVIQYQGTLVLDSLDGKAEFLYAQPTLSSFKLISNKAPLVTETKWSLP